MVLEGCFRIKSECSQDFMKERDRPKQKESEELWFGTELQSLKFKCELMQPVLPWWLNSGEGYFEGFAEFIVIATKILYSQVSLNEILQKKDCGSNMNSFLISRKGLVLTSSSVNPSLPTGKDLEIHFL